MGHGSSTLTTLREDSMNETSNYFPKSKIIPIDLPSNQPTSSGSYTSDLNQALKSSSYNSHESLDTINYSSPYSGSYRKSFISGSNHPLLMSDDIYKEKASPRTSSFDLINFSRSRSNSVASKSAPVESLLTAVLSNSIESSNSGVNNDISPQNTEDSDTIQYDLTLNTNSIFRERSQSASYVANSRLVSSSTKISHLRPRTLSAGLISVSKFASSDDIDIDNIRLKLSMQSKINLFSSKNFLNPDILDGQNACQENGHIRRLFIEFVCSDEWKPHLNQMLLSESIQSGAYSNKFYFNFLEKNKKNSNASINLSGNFHNIKESIYEELNTSSTLKKDLIWENYLISSNLPTNYFSPLCSNLNSNNQPQISTQSSNSNINNLNDTSPKSIDDSSSFEHPNFLLPSQMKNLDIQEDEEEDERYLNSSILSQKLDILNSFETRQPIGCTSSLSSFSLPTSDQSNLNSLSESSKTTLATDSLKNSYYVPKDKTFPSEFSLLSLTLLWLIFQDYSEEYLSYAGRVPDFEDSSPIRTNSDFQISPNITRKSSIGTSSAYTLHSIQIEKEGSDRLVMLLQHVIRSLRPEWLMDYLSKGTWTNDLINILDDSKYPVIISANLPTTVSNSNFIPSATSRNSIRRSSLLSSSPSSSNTPRNSIIMNNGSPFNNNGTIVSNILSSNFSRYPICFVNKSCEASFLINRHDIYSSMNVTSSPSNVASNNANQLSVFSSNYNSPSISIASSPSTSSSYLTNIPPPIITSAPSNTLTTSSLYQFVGSTTEKEQMDWFLQAIERNESLKFCTFLSRKNNESFLNLISSKPVFNKEKESELFFNVFFDIENDINSSLDDLKYIDDFILLYSILLKK